jgi:enamine deaminase RidA (YjgF/YER057c/UK114 family)
MNEAELAAGLPATPHYRYAQRMGNQLFLAGQVPNDAHGQIVGADDPFVQTQQCMNNLTTVMSVHGFAASDIRRLVIYVVGESANLSAAWKAVMKFFNKDVPPATLLGVARLAYPGQLVEVDATVLKE